MTDATMEQPKFDASGRNEAHVLGAAAIINVPDVERTLLWYQDKLGLSVEFAWGEPVVHGGIRAGNTSFHFQQSDVVNEPTAYITLYVQDLDTLFLDLQKQAVEIVSAPEVMPWGMRAFMIHDCNGSLVMFADPSTGE